MAEGSEPPHIATILQELRPLCSGLALCGAGAGGFATLVLHRDRTIEDVRRLIDAVRGRGSTGEYIVNQGLSVHTATIDSVGVQTSFVNSEFDLTIDSIWAYLM